MTNANPYVVSAADAYRGRIEAAAGVTISLKHVVDDDYDDGFCDEYWWGHASRDTDHAYAGGMTSRSAASATASTVIACLDSLAKQLGVSAQRDTIPSVPTMEQRFNDNMEAADAR